MGIETELKLTIQSSSRPRQVLRQKWLRKLAGGPIKSEHLISVYFDTETFTLRDHDVSLRTRKTGRKWIQTIKARADGGDGAFGRGEWEDEIANKTPNYKVAKGTPLAPLLTPKLKRAIRPLFETNIERTTLPVRLGDSLIEVAFDYGQIRTSCRRQQISEIELELKAGNSADLVRLAERFARKLPVSYGIFAKADRGYALVADRRYQAIEATDIALSPGAAVADAFTVIGMSCLHHLAGNEEAVRRQIPEGIHQMRVGLRRLRAAISLFSELVPGPETERIKAELKWLTEQLGPARDFDVLITDGIAPLQQAKPQNPGVVQLIADLSKQRLFGFEKAKAAVESDRYRKAILQTALWLANGKWLRNSNPLASARRDGRIDDYAATLMDSRTKRIVKKIAKLRSFDARHRHKLRIAAKKLRYAAEFFESVFLLKKADAGRKSFEKSLKILQGTLGKLHDIDVHAKLAQSYTHATRRDSERPAKIFAMGMLAGYEQVEALLCMTKAVEASKRLRRAPRYWR